MGAVYRARHRNGRVAAIKIMHTELAHRADLRTRFFAEGRAANLIAHPGVVTILDDGVTDAGEPFLVMELLEGETLWDRRFRERYTRNITEALIVTNQILDVLAVAHRVGVLHRDIKPENVFVTRGGEIKVLDFGVARLEERPRAESESGRRTNTQAGDALGTPAFMAPEQARGEISRVDARSDIWSVGATLFFMLSGRCVHQAVSPMDELMSAMNEPAPSLAEVAPDLPECVVQIVDRALAYDPELRYRDAESMQAAVQGAYAELCHASEPSTPDLDASSASPVYGERRRGFGRFFVGVSLFAAAAAGASLLGVPWTDHARELLTTLGAIRPVATPERTAPSDATAAPPAPLPPAGPTSGGLLEAANLSGPNGAAVIPVRAAAP
jgi:serine/threonine-protein kinase